MTPDEFLDARARFIECAKRLYGMPLSEMLAELERIELEHRVVIDSSGQVHPVNVDLLRDLLTAGLILRGALTRKLEAK